MSDADPVPAEPVKRLRVGWVSVFAVVALIGVIAAVLVPSYGDYSNRAQASEAVSLLSGAKTPLAEYFVARRKWPDSLDGIAETSGKFTRSVAISKGAGGTAGIELTAAMKSEGVDPRVRGLTVRMTSSDGGKSWLCLPGTMPTTNLPAACRN